MKSARTSTLGSIIAASVLASGAALAGPLNPPAGPVSSTGRTVQEIYDKAAAAEPRTAINAANTPGNGAATFRITQAGSYCLAGNITGVSGQAGIEIAASNVTIDLNGFTMSGVAGTGAGIRLAGNGLGAYSNITIRNGSVAGWGDAGIDLNGSGTLSLVEGVTASQNGAFGIRAGVSGAVARRCSFYQNLQQGLLIGQDGRVDECVFVGNGSGGISGGDGVTVRACTFRSNPGAAVSLTKHARVVDCEVNGGGQGLVMTDNAVVTGCTANGTTGSQGGIRVQNASLVEGNTCTGNVGGGIVAAANCTIRGNECVGNVSAGGTSAAGVAVNSDCRVEGNHLMSNDRGLVTNASGCLVIGNTAKGNAINYVLSAGTKNGAIVTSAGSGAVSGSSAASGLSTTDPFANFSL